MPKTNHGDGTGRSGVSHAVPSLQEIDDAISQIDALIAARAAASKRSLKRLLHRDLSGMLHGLHMIENHIDDMQALKRARRMVQDFRTRHA
ncbi:MAG: hypothetical protein U1E16_02590 [Hyphomicrobiales bacterium]